MHEYQLSEFQIRAQVFSPLQILKQATSVNAQLLDRAGQLGQVCHGAVADLIVVDGDPTRDPTVLGGNGERVRMVLKAGVVLKEMS
jgi:imidazolonepropionase-like amidohydrolase